MGRLTQSPAWPAAPPGALLCISVFSTVQFGSTFMVVHACMFYISLSLRVALQQRNKKHGMHALRAHEAVPAVSLHPALATVSVAPPPGECHAAA